MNACFDARLQLLMGARVLLLFMYCLSFFFGRALDLMMGFHFVAQRCSYPRQLGLS